MIKLDFTKQEVEDIKSKIYLSEEEEEILELRLRNKSIIQIADKMKLSESAIDKRIHKIKRKIEKVL